MIKLQVCSSCQSTHYPKRDICPDCWKDTLAYTDVSGKGRLVSSTDLHISVKQEWADKLPLSIGLVKLDAGPILITFITPETPINTAVNVTQDGTTFTAKQ